MAQFDVYRIRGGSLAVDCQADALAHLRSRLVVPLRAIDTKLAENQRLAPMIEVDGKRLMMVTPLARAINVKEIEGTVASLAAERYTIQGALDFLITGS